MFFSIFFLHLPPISLRLHCPVTTTTPPPCPPCHHCPLPTKIPPEQKPILKKNNKKKNPSERQNPEEPANHTVTHANLHQTHHCDPRRSRHDLAGPKHWQYPTTNNLLQPQPNHDPTTTNDPNTEPSYNPLQP